MKASMITTERIGNNNVVTILDDRGKDADIEVHIPDDAFNITIRQSNPDGSGEVIVLSPLQAHFLKATLDAAVQEVPSGTTYQ